METIQFIQYSPQQLQGKITTSVKIQFKKPNKHPKSNKHPKKSKNTAKIIGIILSIIYQSIIVIQIIAAYFIQNSHHEITHFFYFAIYILVKSCIKIRLGKIIFQDFFD